MALVLGLAVVTLLAVVAAKMRDTDKPRSDRYADLSSNLCSASERSAQDPEQAKSLFRTKIHGPLHDLAKETALDDRSAAADLLEAIYSVEGVLEQDPVSGNLDQSLRALNRAAADSLVSVGEEAPQCLRS